MESLKENSLNFFKNYKNSKYLLKNGAFDLSKKHEYIYKSHFSDFINVLSSILNNEEELELSYLLISNKRKGIYLLYHYIYLFNKELFDFMDLKEDYPKKIEDLIKSNFDFIELKNFIKYEINKKSEELIKDNAEFYCNVNYSFEKNINKSFLYSYYDKIESFDLNDMEDYNNEIKAILFDEGMKLFNDFISFIYDDFFDLTNDDYKDLIKLSYSI